MVKKTQIIIPNGRIIVKQKETVRKGPMNMFVASDDEKLLRLAKELSLEAAKEASRQAGEREGQRQQARIRKRNRQQ